MAKKYELVLILDPQIGDAQLEGAVAKYQSRLEAAGAEIGNIDKWGLRKLAYTSMALRQRQQAYYVLYQFAADSRILEALEGEIRLDEAVLRHLVVAVDGDFIRVSQLAPENVYIYQPPDRPRDRRGPRRDRDRDRRPDDGPREGRGGGDEARRGGRGEEGAVAVAEDEAIDEGGDGGE